jgi:hypothetical protein
MSAAEHKEVAESGQERRFELQFGRWGGFDLRPSRAFVWFGYDRERQRIVSYDRPPRLPRRPRRVRYVRLGALQIGSVGSPLVTLPLWLVAALRHATGSSARRPEG